MSGALDLTEPRHLLTKLSHEIDALAADPRYSYAAINALRDAQHLREWIWHGRLEKDPALQAQIAGEKIMGTPKERKFKWDEYVNDKCPNSSLVRQLCNGSKHFKRKSSDKVEATHQAGYGSPLFAYNTGILGYGVDGLFVQVEA